MTRQAVLNTLIAQGELTPTEAEHVFSTYRKIKALKYNAHDGYQLTHGGFFDRATIHRALSYPSV
jgi:hypothetical protein